MNRIFGTSSSKKPTYSITDAISSVCCLNVRISHILTDFQTDSRIQSIEVKIKKLDGELNRYKEQMSKLKNGPGKVRSSSGSGESLVAKRWPYAECDTTESASYSSAKETIRCAA